MAFGRAYIMLAILIISVVLLPQTYADNINAHSPAPAPINHGVGISQGNKGNLFVMVAFIFGYLVL